MADMAKKKQSVLVIMDGLGDRPNDKLNGKTPLEYAKTPVMDKLAREGICGNTYPIAPGIPVGTDVGHLEIFGIDSELVYPGRGPIEAISAGIELIPGDVAFRGNFATVDSDFVVVDRRAGRISEGTVELAEVLNGMRLADGTEVIVKPLTEHRVAVVFRGADLSKAISCTDPGTAKEGDSIQTARPLDCQDKQAARTAENLNEFTRRSYEILTAQGINQERETQGLLPANTILVRGVGKMTDIPNIAKRYHMKAACVAGDKTIGGIARLAGFDYYYETEFTGGYNTNLNKKADKALELLSRGYQWVIVHVKATDLAGHDNLPERKVELIEMVDSMIGRIVAEMDGSACSFGVTADHSTPCEVRDHSGDPVPTILWGSEMRHDHVERAGETYFTEGALNQLRARDIFMMQMDYLGLSPKKGA